VSALIAAASGPDSAGAVANLLSDRAAARECRRLSQQCAVDAAPYVHPRLAAVAVDVRQSEYERMSDEELMREIERESAALGMPLHIERRAIEGATASDDASDRRLGCDVASGFAPGTLTSWPAHRSRCK
jgi:hypothetical protein